MVIPQVPHHVIVGGFINTNTLLCYVCLSRSVPAKKIYVFLFLRILFGGLLLLHTFGRNGVAFVQGAG